MGYINCNIFPDVIIGDFTPPMLMAIINLSPESFYKGSYINIGEFKEKIKTMVENGADILDLGARSTAPWNEKISVEEEFNRLKKALEILKDILPKINPENKLIISIDTQFSSIAEFSLKWAQENNVKMMINDVSSFVSDPNIMDIVIKYQCPVIIMATKEVPGDRKTITEINDAFNIALQKFKCRCEELNEEYDMNKIILDPGVGKWTSEKTYHYDLAMLDNLREFRCFSLPILIGLSRKSFIGAVLEESNSANRYIGTLASTSIAVYNGAHIIRNHDVNKDMIQTIKMAASLKKKPIVEKISNDEENDSVIICELTHPFNTEGAAEHYMNSVIDVSPRGSEIMKSKGVSINIDLKNITAPQALILKQEILSRGGECAIQKNVISTEWKKYEKIHNILLTGTLNQFYSLIEKLKKQDLELNKIAITIESLIKQNKNNYTQNYS